MHKNHGSVSASHHSGAISAGKKKDFFFFKSKICVEKKIPHAKHVGKNILALTDTVRQSRRPHGGPWLPPVAGDGGAALQDEAGIAAVLNGGPHQELGVGEGPGGVLHVAGV